MFVVCSLDISVVVNAFEASFPLLYFLNTEADSSDLFL
jgi:hypothetical protein